MIRPHLSYANVAATLAFLLSLSGIAYAAALPRNSVGPRQLKDSSVTTPKIASDAVKTAKVKNFDLRLRDLGGAINRGSSTVDSQIVVPPGSCEGAYVGGSNPAEAGLVGSLVIGRLTDDQGDAVLGNEGVVVPTMVSESAQGGVLFNLLVCDLADAGLTVPAGSVFHFRLLSP